MLTVMLVISDTSIISNLAIVDMLDVLRRQHPLVVVPDIVADELAQAKDLASKHRIETAFREGWIVREILSTEERVFAAKLKLDEGEAGAIALALFRRADLLLIDERKGRAIADELGLKITGLLGMLLMEKKAGRIASIRNCLNELIDRANFFISPALIKDVIEAAGE
jgi:predicted nucleic acid-binding protein